MQATHQNTSFLTRHALGLAVIAVLGLATASPPAVRAQNYTFTTFDFPGGEGTLAAGINSHGQIVGSYSTPDTYAAFSVSAAQLGLPSAYTSYAVGTGPTEFEGINDSGRIVGDYAQADGSNPGFLLNGAARTDFTPAGQTGVYPAGINNSGVVSGIAYDQNFFSQAFIRSADGTFTLFNHPAANSGSTIGKGNNDAGTTVGSYTDKTSGDVKSFARSAAGVFTDLSVPGVGYTDATDINNLGDVVGDYIVGSGGNQGFLRFADGTLVTLNVPGAADTLILGVNDSRQIVGFYDDATGNTHAFFAAPAAAPEPSAFAGLALGILSVAAFAIKARRRPSYEEILPELR